MAKQVTVSDVAREQQGDKPGLLTTVKRYLDAQPFTLLWWVVFGASIFGLKVLAGPRMDLVVMVMSYVGLALCIVALVTVIPAGIVLWRVMRKRGAGDALVLEADAPVRTGFSVPNLWWLPLLNIEWEWLAPDGAVVKAVRKGFRRHEEVRFSHRDRVYEVVRQFTVADVLGLARIRWKHRTSEVLTVLPAIGQLRQMPVLQAFQSGDEIPHPAGKPEGGRYEIRRYVHGVSARHIVWKIFGRSRRLMVRQPERAIARSTDTAAYLVASPEDEAAAGAARVAVEQGILGQSWLFGADGAPSNVTAVPDALEAIAISGGHRDIDGRGFPHFAENALHRGFNRCIVFAPPTESQWLEIVTGAVATHEGSLEVIIGTDGFSRVDPLPWWKRWIFAPKEVESADKVERLDRVVNRLRKCGIATTVIDRPTGRLIGGATRNAMMKLSGQGRPRLPGSSDSRRLAAAPSQPRTPRG